MRSYLPLIFDVIGIFTTQLNHQNLNLSILFSFSSYDEECRENVGELSLNHRISHELKRISEGRLGAEMALGVFSTTLTP